MGSRTMDRTGAPQNWWFLALALSVLTWNISVIEIKGTWTTPATMVGLGIPDISPYLCFELYQDVYYVPVGGVKFPKVKERRAHWAGISPTVGQDMT